MVGFAQMVILLSFLSSSKKQQNNVITVAALTKVLTSFPYSVQFLKSDEQQPPAEIHIKGRMLACCFSDDPGPGEHWNDSLLGTLLL